jgi:hypothetical protein
MLGAQTNFLVFLAVVGTFSALVWLFKPQLLRLKNYFAQWAERDRRAEEQARREVTQRTQAEKELREKLVEDEPEEAVQRVQR